MTVCSAWFPGNPIDPNGRPAGNTKADVRSVCRRPSHSVALWYDEYFRENTVVDPVLDGGFRDQEEKMNKRLKTKLVHEGQYVAEVDVEVIEAETGWSPYLSIEDAYKLDDVRSALRRGDLKGAAGLARVFTLTPVNM